MNYIKPSLYSFFSKTVFFKTAKHSKRFIIISLVLAALISGACGSAPDTKPAPEPKSEETKLDSSAPQPVDGVWATLQSGNSERARAYFTGEVDIHAVNPENGMTPLHYAASNNDHQLAAYFIFIGADVDALDNRGRTPLAINVSNSGDTDKQARTTHALIEGKSKIFAPMPGNTTPGAVALTKPNVLKAMVETPSIISTEDAEGKTLLDLALARPDSKTHMEATEILIKAGAYSSSPLFSYLAPAVRSLNFNLRVGDGITPLHYAARQEYTGLIEYLLDRDADVNMKTAAGSTPLHEAAITGNITNMEMLIAKGADVNAQDAKGNSVMHIAIPAGSHQEALSLLLKNNANPNSRDEHGDSPLHILITLSRDGAIVKTLLEGGANTSIRNIDGKTPLYLAVEENKPDYIPLLLSYNADIFAADNKGMTPFEKVLTENTALLPLFITPETVLQSDGAGNTILHITVAHRANVDIVGVIFDNGAQVDARNKAGDTSLNMAVRQNNEPVGTLLLSKNADIFAANARGESPLYSAFFPPDKKLRQWMLTPQTLAARDGLGNTALHYAAQWKLDEYIPLMATLGSDVEARNATGETPLFTAVKYDAPSTIRVLTTKAGASINTRDRLGNTALHAAVRWDASNAGASLIALGIDVNAHALNGKTALHDAVRTDKTGMERLLTKNGADIDSRDAEGNTPLMEAIAGGFSAPAERLAALGADASVRNTSGDTPLHLAVKMNNIDLAGTLLRLGASIHARNSQGQTPFRIALVTSPVMVSLLLADNRVILADDDGLSPLHIAICDKAPLVMIQAIINQKARLSAVDSAGKIPLRLAADADNWGLAKILTEAGSDVFSEAGDGKSPAAIALAKGREALDALFSGVAISVRDRSGNTILHYAAQYGTLEEISQLISLGADKYAQNISGDTPAEAAIRWKRPDIAAALQ
ncbi:MAG: ankyrin repeat domain-containing protein [Treponema sp.]|jgi:ankyrin repeat protein|nr:ankyrin repeat domain-containing protein [Treponema sp.]